MEQTICLLREKYGGDTLTVMNIFLLYDAVELLIIASSDMLLLLLFLFGQIQCNFI